MRESSIRLPAPNSAALRRDVSPEPEGRRRTQITLLERLRSGDERALAELADTYRTRIFQLAFRYLRNKEDAEEVTQDVLYKVYRNVADFRGDAAISSWIYRITFNAAMSRIRTVRFRQSQADARNGPGDAGEPAKAKMDVADWSAMGDEYAYRSQLRQRLHHAVMGLPDIYRAPVLLRDIQGMSTEEASARLQLKDQTLKSRLHRGRLILRKQLADFAGGLTLHRPCYNC
jgi:RNA polymerase sigma-70 factor (ECF subfamily)